MAIAIPRLPIQPQKIALLRASRIGDFICATPAFRALRMAFPEAEVCLIGMPFVQELVKRSPYLDRFISFPGFPGMAEQFFDPKNCVAFFRQMQLESFDLAIQMHGSGVYSNPVALMLGADVTVGFVRSGDPPGRLDAAFPMPEDLHEIRRLLALLNFLGIPSQGEQTSFPLWQEDHQLAMGLLPELPHPLIGLHPAAGEPGKCWAKERFIQTGIALLQQYGGTIVLLGSQSAWELAEGIARSIGPGAINLTGKTSLPVLGGVIDRLALLLTNDSGPAHIAYALGTPTVTLFGDTDPAVWGALPLGRHQMVQAPASVGGASLQSPRNLDRISVGQVLEQVGRILCD